MKIDKIINSNDNNSTSWLTRYSLEENAVFAKNIPLADWFIAKYCKEWWKNHQDTPEYQYLQMCLCMQLHQLVGKREDTLRFIAVFLDVPAITIMNDTSDEIKKIPDAYYAGDGTPPIITYREE